MKPMGTRRLTVRPIVAPEDNPILEGELLRDGGFLLEML
jgi:hypothetical protein